MRLLLLKICVGAMYFIIACSHLQVSGEFVQPKQLIDVKQENLIRPGYYYSYEILKNPEKSKTEWQSNARSQADAFPKKHNDLPTSSENIFKISQKLLSSKSESPEKHGLNLSRESRKMIDKENRGNKEVVKGNYKRFPLNAFTFSANLKKQEINRNFNNGKIIGFANYLERMIQDSVKAEATSFSKINPTKEIPKSRRVRDIFPPLVDFKDLQTAIKASTYFSLYKDGNLSSFEHFDFHTNTHNYSTTNNASQETPRPTRNVNEKENLIEKKSAVSNFLLELQDALEIVKFLTDGMFYPREKDSDELYYSNATSANDTLDDEKATREIRQSSKKIDPSTSFKKKRIEMEQLTESISKSRCKCLVNKNCGLEGKTQKTEHENCENYEEVSKIAKNLNSLLHDFVDISYYISEIKLKKFRSELQKLRKRLSNIP